MINISPDYEVLLCAKEFWGAAYVTLNQILNFTLQTIVAEIPTGKEIFIQAQFNAVYG